MHIGWAFEATDLRYPELPAIADGEEVLGYSDWYRRAAGLAAWLAGPGSSPAPRYLIVARSRPGTARQGQGGSIVGLKRQWGGPKPITYYPPPTRRTSL